MSNAVSLKTLIAPSKKVTVDFPGLEGFKLDLAFLSREATVNIRKKATTQSFKGGRHVSEEFNEELFLKLFTEQTLLGWQGLKFSYLEQLAPVELEGIDPDDTLAFSPENALYLVKNSSAIDNFVSGIVNDLGNFTKSKQSS